MTAPHPVTLFTWNILAPEYAAPRTGEDTRDFYRFAHPWDEWDRRRPRILARVATCEADVLCLQEVSEPFFDQELRAFLDAQGFEAAYRARVGQSGSVGVLVAHRRSLFAGEPLTTFGTPEDEGRFAAATLRPHTGGPSLTVVSVHLEWSPEDSDRRERLDRAMAGLDGLDARPGDAAQLLVGDVNFDPYAHPAWPKWAAAGWQTSHPRPDMPTWAADGRCERLDAILLRGSIALAGAAPVPTLTPIPGLPSEIHPSDHIPLAAVFRL